MNDQPNATAGQWARQQQQGMKRQERKAAENGAHRESTGTNEHKEIGAARFEPEKEGGIGGP